MYFDFIFQIPSNKDFFLAFGAVLFIGSVLVGTELLKIKLNWSEEYTRKIVHISVGILAAIAPLYFSSPSLLIIIAIFFGITDWFAVRKGFFKGIHGNRFSYGTVYFPLSYVILLITFWSVNKYLIVIAILYFAIPDALAAIVGQSLRNPRSFILIRDKKTLEGSVTHFISGFLLLTICFELFDFKFASPETIWIIAFCISLVVTVVEMLSIKGSDNLLAPLSGALLTYIFLTATADQLNQIFLGIFLAVLIIFLSYYLKFLSPSGLATTFLLATFIFGLGGLKWSIPILIFFILSSFLSKAGKGIKAKFKDTFEKSSLRDHAQVLANGGMAWVLVTLEYFIPHDFLYYLYLLSLAVATADTWGTEIGVFLETKPRLITTFKKVEPGISGAISWHGSMGAFMGSLILISSGFIFLERFTPGIFILLVCLGFIGSMIDSLIGATIQGQFRCKVCNKYTEKRLHCGHETIHEHGLIFITNDFVNFSSSLITILLFLAIHFNLS